jgi:hypothetical protein
MRKLLLILSLVTLPCLGVTCTISVPGGGSITGSALSNLDAEVTLSRATGEAQTNVSARITNIWGLSAQLEDDQALSVNNVELVEASTGVYTATVPAASSYTLTVLDPTRGQESTSITEPDEFDITTPPEGGATSLSGFTLSWSNANEQYQVEITLSQTISSSTASESFGPMTDTGSQTFTAADLRDFRQSAPLFITVTRISQQSGVAGFGSGLLFSRLSTTRIAQPSP